MSQDLINHLLAALLNFSDLHDEFCLACSEITMVQLFVDMTKDLQDCVPYHVKFVVGIKARGGGGHSSRASEGFQGYFATHLEKQFLHKQDDFRNTHFILPLI